MFGLKLQLTWTTHNATIRNWVVVHRRSILGQFHHIQNNARADVPGEEVSRFVASEQEQLRGALEGLEAGDATQFGQLGIIWDQYLRGGRCIRNVKHSDGRFLAGIEEQLLVGLAGVRVQGRSAKAQVIAWNTALFNVATAADGEHGDSAALLLGHQAIRGVVQTGYGVGSHLKVQSGAVGLRNKLLVNRILLI